MHPINVLFSDKIASLTYSNGGIVFSQSYDEVCKLAKGEHIGSEPAPKEDK